MIRGLVVSTACLAITGHAMGWRTFSFEAPIKDAGSVRATLSSGLDRDGNVHMAWVQTDSSKIDRLMYAKFLRADTTVSIEQIPAPADSIKHAPDLFLSSAGNIHIAWFADRTRKTSTNTGNSAVYHAQKLAGGWDLSQVSTNPLDWRSNQWSRFACYVVGAPTQFEWQGALTVAYKADAADSTNWDHHMILARKQGGGWLRTEELNLDSLLGQTGENNGPHFPASCGARVMAGKIDISEYRPSLLVRDEKWREIQYPQFHHVLGGNKSMEIHNLPGGKLLMAWAGMDSSRMRWATIGPDLSVRFDSIKVGNSISGNIAGSAADSVDGSIHFLTPDYNGNIRIHSSLQGGGGFIETVLPDAGIGIPYGRRSLHALAGRQAAVTASATAKRIYVTLSDSTQVGIHSKRGVSPFSVRKSQNQIEVSTSLSGAWVVETFTIDGRLHTRRVSKENIARFPITPGIQLVRIRWQGGSATFPIGI